MTIEIHYKGYTLQEAIARALGVKNEEVEVTVAPCLSNIPFLADWRVIGKGVADIVCYVKGEQMKLQLI